MKIQNSKIENGVKARPPVVVVLGHVDHGKTTLLDFIRKTKVAQKEAGGITQHIGAYDIEYQGNLITFIDTPGHEAFEKMRSRGAKVADIALLVVDSSEGVKAQTKEALDHIKEAKIPYIVVLNKIDLPTAQPEWVKQELYKIGVQLEEFGGDIPAVLVSAKTGQGIDDLLEMILLVAQIQQLKTDISLPGSGVILEAHLDDTRGPTATLLLRQGTLAVGDIVATQSTFGKIRSLENFLGQPITGPLEPSIPAVAIGFLQVPQVGEIFEVKKNLKEVQQKFLKQQLLRPKKLKLPTFKPENETKLNRPILKLIVKADAQGSLEAIESILKSIPQDKVKIEIIWSGLGMVSENDVELAKEAKAVILAFNVKTSKTAKELAHRDKIQIVDFEVVYHMVQKVKELMAKKLPPELIKEEIGKIKILETFGKKKGKQIIGGKVTEGKIERGSLIQIWRSKEKIGEGKVLDLQKNRKPIREGTKGDEVGILYDGSGEIQKGDLIVIFRETKKKVEL